MGPVCRPCFLRALPVAGVSNLWALAICPARGALVTVSLSISSELEGSFPILLLMACLCFAHFSVELLVFCSSVSLSSLVISGTGSHV